MLPAEPHGKNYLPGGEWPPMASEDDDFPGRKLLLAMALIWLVELVATRNSAASLTGWVNVLAATGIVSMLAVMVPYSFYRGAVMLWGDHKRGRE